MKRYADLSRRLCAAVVILLFCVPWGVLGQSPVISEFVASNANGLEDEDGERFDWLELYNPSGSAVDLGGFYLTDKADNLVKWAVPAGVIVGSGETLLFFASEKDRRDPAGVLHTNFKLSASGEFLALVAPDGVTVVHGFGDGFPAQMADVSYGLLNSSDVGSVGFFDPPTPGAVNGGSFANFVSAVGFSRTSGMFFEAFDLVLSGAQGGETIRYVTREVGSRLDEPTVASAEYTAPIPIDATTQVRARVFGADGTPGETVTHTYILGDEGTPRYAGATIKDFTSHLPIMVLTNFRQTTLTSNRGSETDMHWLIYEPNEATGGRSSVLNEPDLATRGRIKIRGSSTQGNAKYSLSVEAWDEADEDKDVSVLGLPAESDWVLSGRYTFDRALMRNPLMYELSNQLGRYAVRTRFVEVYVDTNGGTTGDREYMGVYTLMEKIKRGGDRVDVAGLSPAQIEEPEVTGGYLFKVDRRDPGDTGFSIGNDANRREPPFEAPLAYIDPKEPVIERIPAQRDYLTGALTEAGDALYAADGISPATGRHYSEIIDVPAWLDHHWLNTLAMNVDGFRLSGYYHKDREGPIVAGPIWDFDRTMESNDGRDDDPLSWDGPPDSSRTWYDNRYRIWGWLLGYRTQLTLSARRSISSYESDRPDVFQQHTDRWFELREEVFSVENIHGVIDRMAAEIGDAQERNFVRWREVFPRSSSSSRVRLLNRTYEGEVAQLKEWLKQRVEWIDAQYPEIPVLSQDGGVVAPGFELGASAGEGTVYVAPKGGDPRAAGGEVGAGAVEVGVGTPVALPRSALVVARTKRDWMWSAPVEAYFVVGEERASASNLVVSEVMYHPASPSAEEIAAGYDNSDDFEFIELLNPSDQTVNLYELMLTEGVDFDFSKADITSLRPGERGIIVRKRGAIELRYGPGLPVIGKYNNDQLKNGGELVTLLGAGGVTLQSFTYSDSIPWPDGTDGTGASLVLQNPGTFPNHNLPESWAASSYAGGTPGFPDGAYYDWKVANGVVADFGDRDGDGTFELAEFIFGTGIDDPSSGLATNGPKAVVSDLGGVPVPTVTVVVSDAAVAAGAVLEPEVSADMEEWLDGVGLVTLTGEVSNGDGTKTRIYSVDESVGSGAWYVRFRLGIR